VVCTPEDQGRLGIHDLQVKNTALLGKWLFKLLTKNGIWQTILKQKYVGAKALSQVSWKEGDSHFWVGLMATKSKILRFEHFTDQRWFADKVLGEQMARKCHTP
jgi:hypothetical protein